MTALIKLGTAKTNAAIIRNNKPRLPDGYFRIGASWAGAKPANKTKKMVIAADVTIDVTTAETIIVRQFIITFNSKSNDQDEMGETILIIISKRVLYETDITLV